MGNYNHAIAWYENVIDNTTSQFDSVFAVIDLSHLYMVMPDSIRYICKYPQLKPTSWEAFENSRADLLASLKLSCGSEENSTPITQISVSNYPNPFNPETTISFVLPKTDHVKIEIFNIRGQKVTTLCNENYLKGQHSVLWQGKDDNGSNVSTGIYFYQLKTKERTIVKKMMLLK